MISATYNVATDYTRCLGSWLSILLQQFLDECSVIVQNVKEVQKKAHKCFFQEFFFTSLVADIDSCCLSFFSFWHSPHQLEKSLWYFFNSRKTELHGRKQRTNNMLLLYGWSKIHNKNKGPTALTKIPVTLNPPNYIIVTWSVIQVFSPASNCGSLW